MEIRVEMQPLQKRQQKDPPPFLVKQLLKRQEKWLKQREIFCRFVSHFLREEIQLFEKHRHKKQSALSTRFSSSAIQNRFSLLLQEHAKHLHRGLVVFWKSPCPPHPVVTMLENNNMIEGEDKSGFQFCLVCLDASSYLLVADDESLNRIQVRENCAAVLFKTLFCSKQIFSAERELDKEEEKDKNTTFQFDTDEEEHKGKLCQPTLALPELSFVPFHAVIETKQNRFVDQIGCALSYLPAPAAPDAPVHLLLNKPTWRLLGQNMRQRLQVIKTNKIHMHCSNKSLFGQWKERIERMWYYADRRDQEWKAEEMQHLYVILQQLWTELVFQTWNPCLCETRSLKRFVQEKIRKHFSKSVASAISSLFWLPDTTCEFWTFVFLSIPVLSSAASSVLGASVKSYQFTVAVYASFFACLMRYSVIRFPEIVVDPPSLEFEPTILDYSLVRMSVVLLKGQRPHPGLCLCAMLLHSLLEQTNNPCIKHEHYTNYPSSATKKQASKVSFCQSNPLERTSTQPKISQVHAPTTLDAFYSLDSSKWTTLVKYLSFALPQESQVLLYALYSNKSCISTISTIQCLDMFSLLAKETRVSNFTQDGHCSSSSLGAVLSCARAIFLHIWNENPCRHHSVRLPPPCFEMPSRLGACTFDGKPRPASPRALSLPAESSPTILSLPAESSPTILSLPAESSPMILSMPAEFPPSPHSLASVGCKDMDTETDDYSQKELELRPRLGNLAAQSVEKTEDSDADGAGAGNSAAAAATNENAAAAAFVCAVVSTRTNVTAETTLTTTMTTTTTTTMTTPPTMTLAKANPPPLVDHLRTWTNYSHRTRTNPPTGVLAQAEECILCDEGAACRHRAIPIVETTECEKGLRAE